MARDLMYPAPRNVMDEADRALRGITDSDTRYRIRELARYAYATGYAEGHVQGIQEAWSDRKAEKDAAEEANALEAARQWELLHEAIHGGLADCDETGADGSRCGSCLGCRITQEVGEHD